MRSLSLAWVGLALSSRASAFCGQMAATPYTAVPGSLIIELTDYTTGSKDTTKLADKFNGCSGGTQCDVTFNEYTAGEYHFNARLWRTNDGCYNLDFEGALDAHHDIAVGRCRAISRVRIVKQLQA